MRGGLAAAARKWGAAHTRPSSGPSGHLFLREKAIRKDTTMLNFILGPSGSG